MKKKGKGKRSVKISACMMVKNEEEMLPRCLNSIKHLVDEIIVVDTGSSDNTVEIARSFGAKIYHHPWENDFSKHRNQSIGYVTGDWFLIIDADEELDAYELKKKDLENSIGKAPKELHCFLIKVLDKDKEGNIASASESARIFRNNVGVEYRGIVHNTASYSGSVAPLDLRLFHYGYALSEEQMQDKYKRTSGLLLKRIEKDPLDHAAYFYLFQVYMEMKESQRAIGYANQCLEILSQGGESKVDPSFYYSLYHGVANAYIKTQVYEKAENMARRGLEIIPDEVDLFYDLAAIGYFINNPDLMIEGGENYLRVVNDFRTKATRAGTRFVFTASEDGELHISFWLMLAYINHERFDEFFDIWEKKKEDITANPFYQKKLFAVLEEKGALGTLADIGSYLLSRLEVIPVEGRREVLSRLMFVLRDKIARQEKNYKENDGPLETVVSQYLDLVESYDAIPCDDAIILSEFLLNKDMGEFFLDLTLSLFKRELAGKIKILDTEEVVAAGYDLIAKKQKKDRKGLLLSLSCLNIAWKLTGAVPYREAFAKAEAELKGGAGEYIIGTPEQISSGPTSLSVLRAAFGEVNITPKFSADRPVLLQGMAGNERRAIGVASPLKMQILLVEDENGTRILLVSADLFGFGKEMVEIVRNAASGWGIPAEGIILNASHTHYAPGTVSHASRTLGPYYEEYAKEVAGIIANSLPSLYDRLELSKIYSGKADSIDIGVNRRLEENGQVKFYPNEAGVYDRHTPFLLIELQQSCKKIIMVNHGCHPTGLGAEVNLSADFPGYFRDALIKTGKVHHVMYLQGASGNIKESVECNGGKSFASSSEDAQKNGEIMAEAIAAALDDKDLIQLTDAPIACRRAIVILPLKRLPDIGTINLLKDDDSADPVIREWASMLTEKYPSGNFPNALDLEVQTVAIGKQVAIITCPAEPVAELGISIKHLTDFPESTFVLGYTNGLTCYLPDDKIISQGGYESDVSPYYYQIPYLLAHGTEATVLLSVKKCYATLHAPVPGKIYGRYQERFKTPGKAFFTLSAGRCGTQTLAHTLNAASNARVWHHPQPFLVDQTYEAYKNSAGGNEKKETFWRARGQFIYKTWSEELIHGETDHNMTPFCDVIARDIPESKFIVLVRNPWDFVRSGMRRNYYNGHPWDSGRLRPEKDHDDFQEWNHMSQFEKVCWLWNETYAYILRLIATIESDRIVIVKFEDMIQSADKLSRVAEFLGLESITESCVEVVLQEKLNAQQGGVFETSENWSEEMKIRIWQICGGTADVFGYENRFSLIS